MGKTVIRASDGPGFLVNRCNRPFGLEALRLLQERIADIETIDRICRMEGGFRMGPFELMDLVGVDTGFEISKSFYRAELRRAALAPLADHGALRRRRAARAQERPRLLRLHERRRRRGLATARTIPSRPADERGRRRGRGGDHRRRRARRRTARGGRAGRL